MRQTLSLITMMVLLGAAQTAAATTITLAGVPELADRAQIIVEGTVLSTKATATKARPGLFTDHAVAVDTVYKGNVGDALTVRVPGGKLDSREVHIEGMPKLVAGSRVILFLEALPSGAFETKDTFYLPLGLGQGHFVLDASAAEPSFHRPDLVSGMTPTKFWCTGGEWTARFEAKTLRSWLRALAIKSEGNP